ncbi:MAG: hypothetical protein J0L73_14040 [Verrucomicrobia bacterium]|nr:hypothetical protein [Verrucomicrobiota bacterium]
MGFLLYSRYEGEDDGGALRTARPACLPEGATWRAAHPRAGYRAKAPSR